MSLEFGKEAVGLLTVGVRFGGLFRDSSGDPLLAFAESIGSPSILNIELAGISHALKMGLNMNINKIIVESDSKIAIDIINGKAKHLLSPHGIWLGHKAYSIRAFCLFRRQSTRGTHAISARIPSVLIHLVTEDLPHRTCNCLSHTAAIPTYASHIVSLVLKRRYILFFIWNKTKGRAIGLTNWHEENDIGICKSPEKRIQYQDRELSI